MSLRKSFSETSEPSPALKFQTLFAHCSNVVSCVSPRSSVMGSYFVRPGDLRLMLGSPPCRNSTTSVWRSSGPTCEIPATYLPSHFKRNLKFLYGSKRCGLAGNSATHHLAQNTLPHSTARRKQKARVGMRVVAQLRKPLDTRKYRVRLAAHGGKICRDKTSASFGAGSMRYGITA